MVSTSADKPLTQAGKQYHIRCQSGDLAPYLLIPGDPERVLKIIKFWDYSRKVAYHREFLSYTGEYKGVSISTLSSGIGPACVSIAVNEAANVGVGTFLRVGSSGAIQSEIKCGDLVISSAAVRLDGASNSYIMPEYPAFASYEVMLALIEAAEGLGVRYHVGITATTSDFYAGQARPALHDNVHRHNFSIMKDLERGNVLNFEMESATLFTLCNILGLRSGTVCAVYANRITNEFVPGAGEEWAIRVANKAVTILKKWDNYKKEKKKEYFYPGLLKH